MPRLIRQHREAHAKPLEGRWQPLLGTQSEQHVGGRLDGKPGVGAQLALELTGLPAGIPQGDQQAGGVQFAAAHGLQDIPRGGQADLVIDRQGGLPGPQRRMQDKTPVHLHRTTVEHWLGTADIGRHRDVDLFQQSAQGKVDWPVHHHAKGTIAIVTADVGKRIGKIRVGHRRHGNQEMIGQVDRCQRGTHARIIA